MIYQYKDIKKLYEEKNNKVVSRIVKDREISNKDRDEWLLPLTCKYNHTSLGIALSKLPSTQVEDKAYAKAENRIYKHSFTSAINNENQELAISLINNKKVNNDVIKQNMPNIVRGEMMDVVSEIFSTKKSNTIDNQKELLSAIHNNPLSERGGNRLKDIFKAIPNFEMNKEMLRSLRSKGDLIFDLRENKNIEMSDAVFDSALEKLVNYMELKDMREGIDHLISNKYPLPESVLGEACIAHYNEQFCLGSDDKHSKEIYQYTKDLFENFKLYDYVKDYDEDIADKIKRDIEKEKIQQNVMNF